jgi:hypothetical protein
VPAAFPVVDALARWIGPKVSGALAPRPTKAATVKPHAVG